jgi:hypothetical protein
VQGMPSQQSALCMQPPPYATQGAPPDGGGGGGDGGGGGSVVGPASGVVKGGVQAPAWQVAVGPAKARQLWLQVPQWAGSFWVSTQTSVLLPRLHTSRQRRPCLVR